MVWGEMTPPESMTQATDFHQYAYGVFAAVELAARLKIPAVTVIELGVAGGNGLLELERLGVTLGSERGVEATVVGFDGGTGMPKPQDYRDNPYAWREGFFGMDEALLRSRLRVAELIIGEVSETCPRFLQSQPPPIGFVSFDLDYYSSTDAALRTLLEGDRSRYLPRVLCYFDDTVGPHSEMHSEYTGELLAISEFNERNPRRKLARLNGLRHKVGQFDGPWVEGMFVLHIFDHPDYGTYVHSESDRQFPLTHGGAQ